MSRLLLKGGIVLIHGDKDKITPTKTDILVEGNRITKIETNIDTPTDGCNLIDCTDKIISPGFVDTHHHVWQSPLKGLFGDMAFLPYFAIIAAAGTEFTPEDIFWANLAGSMEAIDAGTTTVLDHAHMNWSKDHSKSAVAGTITSGIRSIFAYTPTGIMKSLNPEIEFSPEVFPPWVMEVFEQLAKSHPLTDPESPVQIGFGFDFYFLPKQMVQGLFAKVRALGAKVITSHFVKHIGHRGESLASKLKSYDLLDHGVVLSHGGGATAEDAKLLHEANCFVSSTPNTEQAMGVGPPVLFRNDLPLIDEVCSLGIDCHSATSSSLVNEMRTALQSARGLDSAVHARNGQLPKEIFHTAAEVFNLGTIQGARALSMEKDIGSISVGKKADFAIFDTLSPAMIGAAQQDPLTAIVLHSNIGDIDTVVVDGQVRKQNGKLVPVPVTEWNEGKGFGKTDRTASWGEVGRKLLDIQHKFVSKMPEYQLPKLEAKLTQMYGM